MAIKQHYHFIGIGGIGMSGIAQILLRRGVTVSGSDLKASRATECLKKEGASIYLGHDAGHIKGAEIVVYSSAIKEDNPEMLAARAARVPLIKRAEALADLMKDKKVITVTGSHGKTTTSSLVSYMLLEAGLRPTIAVGGILKNIDANASCGEGSYFVAEADESDGSFLCYRPLYSIITNIDYEHLDYYKTFQNALKAFKEFMGHTDEAGCLFACGDDPHIAELLKGYTKRCVRFGLNDHADIYSRAIVFKGLSSEFECVYKGKPVDRFLLALGGEHNISNALSVIALGLELGIETAVIKKTLAHYLGSGRRLEVKFKSDEYILIDDYAHHPTEIRATLAAIRHMDYQRIVAVFQPHRFTRTQLLMDEFTRCFDDVDSVVITDIYAASEAPIEGVTGSALAAKIKKRLPDKHIEYVPKDEVAGYLSKTIKAGDLVIMLGAGDITRLCDELAEKCKRESKVG
jgi:UDP-N-acetylmuramate--alanine ligase